MGHEADAPGAQRTAPIGLDALQADLDRRRNGKQPDDER
jgi:hypothetical protein